MEKLKQGLAFPMYGAAVWLVWVLAQQSGINAIAIALTGMVIIAFAAWLYETTKSPHKITQIIGVSLSSISLTLVLIASYMGIERTPTVTAPTTVAAKNYEAYTPSRLNDLRNAGKPVFVNLTAAWCISCLVNEKVALSQDSVINAFKAGEITYLKGDWTNRDDEITQLLSEFGRSGVPLYIYYPGKQSSLRDPIVLPQVLSPEIVIRTVQTPQSTKPEV